MRILKITSPCGVPRVIEQWPARVYCTDSSIIGTNGKFNRTLMAKRDVCFKTSLLFSNKRDISEILVLGPSAEMKQQSTNTFIRQLPLASPKLYLYVMFDSAQSGSWRGALQTSDHSVPRLLCGLIRQNVMFELCQFTLTPKSNVF